MKLARFPFVCLLQITASAGTSISFAATEPAQEPAKVITQIAKKTSDADILLFPARTYSRVQTNLYAENDGIVRTLPYFVGQKIQKGAVLATIQNTDPVYHYAAAKVYAQEAGVVSSLEVRLGTHVTKGMLLGTITDPAKLRLTIEVPAQDLNAVKAGTVGEFKAANYSSSVAVKVLGVSPLVDPRTGTASAELEVVGKELIPAGMVGQVSLRSNEHQAIIIPEDAVVYHDGKPWVRTVVDGALKSASVELGPRRRGTIEIKTGLKDQDVIILRASRYVPDGEKVIAEPAKNSIGAKSST